MSTKGLCDTCFSGKKCALPKKFPVLNCEDFSFGESKGTAKKRGKKRK